MIDGPNIANGGRIGRFVGDGLAGLITHPGSFVVCAALVVVGVLLALDMSLPTLLRPLGRGARTVGQALTAPAAEDDERRRQCRPSGQAAGCRGCDSGRWPTSDGLAPRADAADRGRPARSR